MATLLPLWTFVLTLAICAASAAQTSEEPVVVDYKYGLDLYFSANSARAMPAEEKTVSERITTAQRAVPKVREWCALIAGYTDSKEGDTIHRRALALERSLTVKQLLLSAGLTEAGVHTEASVAQDTLFASGDPRNRRVEVEIFPCWKQ